MTSGVFANAVETQGSGTSASLTGTTITTTGNGSAGASLVGTGSSLTLSGVSITTSGTTDASGHNAVGVFTGNASTGLYPGGGTLGITKSTILTHGDYALGVLAENNGLTTVNGGSINTTGNAAYAVSVDTGGVVKLAGTTIGTTGNGSGGLAIHSTASEIDATGVSITTTGGFDSVSGQHSYGVYNGPFGTFTTGGVAKLTDTSVSTQGAQMYRVITSTGGSTTFLGGSIATSGFGASAILS
jgi:hypothetical protein